MMRVSPVRSCSSIRMCSQLRVVSDPNAILSSSRLSKLEPEAHASTALHRCSMQWGWRLPQPHLLLHSCWSTTRAGRFLGLPLCFLCFGSVSVQGVGGHPRSCKPCRVQGPSDTLFRSPRASSTHFLVSPGLTEEKKGEDPQDVSNKSQEPTVARDEQTVQKEATRDRTQQGTQ